MAAYSLVGAAVILGAYYLLAVRPILLEDTAANDNNLKEAGPTASSRTGCWNSGLQALAKAWETALAVAEVRCLIRTGQHGFFDLLAAEGLVFKRGKNN